MITFLIYAVIILFVICLILLGAIWFITKGDRDDSKVSLAKELKKSAEEDIIKLNKEYQRIIDDQSRKIIKLESDIKKMENEIGETLKKAKDMANGDVDMSGFKPIGSVQP